MLLGVAILFIAHIVFYEWFYWTYRWAYAYTLASRIEDWIGNLILLVLTVWDDADRTKSTAGSLEPRGHRDSPHAFDLAAQAVPWHPSEDEELTGLGDCRSLPRHQGREPDLAALGATYKEAPA